MNPQQTHRLSALGTLVTSWRRHLQAANLSPKTIKSYLASVEQLEAFLAEAGMTTEVTALHLAADKTPSGLWPSDHAGVVTTWRCSHQDGPDTQEAPRIEWRGGGVAGGSRWATPAGSAALAVSGCSNCLHCHMPPLH